MTKLLEQAFAVASALPEHDQDFLGEMILDEIAQDRAFDAKISATAHLLEPLAEEAVAEHRAGLAVDLDEVLDEIDNQQGVSQEVIRASATSARTRVT